MSFFLQAGFVGEYFQTIRETAERLEKLLASAGQQLTWSSLEEVKGAVGEILEQSRQACELLDRLPCQPIIYTGEGKTEEVIAMLDRLLYLQQSPAACSSNRKKHASG